MGIKFEIGGKWALIRVGVVLAAMVVPVFCMTRMPGKSFRGGNPPATPAETALAAELRADVEKLAVGIGVRNLEQAPEKLREAADYIAGELERAGYHVERQGYACGEDRSVENLVAELRGTRAPDEIVVVGAHYDSAESCPAANDNGSGIAAVLALARQFAGKPQGRTLRFVAFANEEPPHFRTGSMGSRVYAKACREKKEKVTAMLSLETMGCFSDASGSQKYPGPIAWFYPSTGNFIAFVGNFGSRGLLRQCIRVFRENVRVGSEGAALPGFVQGVGWSDHESFWLNGYDALMVTDTAPCRYPYYHTPEDTPDKLDYVRFARVVAGLAPVLRTLAE